MKLIQISGIDGVGKSTALRHLTETLKVKGYRVLETREVGNPHDPTMLELRKIVLEAKPRLDGKVMEYIFAAMGVANALYYNNVRQQYDYIVSDRGLIDHLAYTDVNVNPEFTDRFYLGAAVHDFMHPDYVVYLDASPEVAAKRMSKRGTTDAIEEKGLQFQMNVRDAFELHMKHNRLNITRINANLDVEGVRKQLDDFITALVNKTL